MKMYEKIPASIINNLLYRSQFILGPNFIDKFHSWKRIKIDSSAKLTVHPDLDSYQVVSDDKSITLLGFILNSESPQSSDNDIIDHLVNKLKKLSH